MRDVLLAARRFRTAISQNPPPLVSFASFPSGACGDASEFLGQYLIDSGLGEWLYRTAFTIDLASHAWLEQDGIIVDMTADQFPAWELPAPVVVTSDRAWHDEHFPSQDPLRRPAGLVYWEGPTHHSMVRAYGALRTRADALHLAGPAYPSEP